MPDSALVLRAYKTWGEDCTEHLVGDFAFAIWDGRANKLVLARDHMGQRSVLYYHGTDFFAFTTEATALWAVPGVPRKLSETAVGRHLLLANARSGNATLFEDIHHVPGGCTVVVGGGGKLAERRYWTPHADPGWINRTEDEYVDQYRAIVTEAVECRIRRLIAPPALLLSGGFDSSAIAGLAGAELTKQGRKLIAVSAVLEESADDISSNARSSVEMCRRHMPHLDVRYITRSHELGLDDLEPAFLRAKGIPTVDHNITDILFQEASAAGARLMMDGIGGDETVNPRGGGFLQYLLRTGQWGRFLVEARAHLRRGARPLRGILRNDLIAAQAPFWLRRIRRRLRHGGKPAWMDRPIAPTFATRLIDTGAINPAEIIVRLRPYLSTPARMEKVLLRLMAMSSHHSANEAAARELELTRPMLDKRVVEFARAIPEGLYVKDGRDRHLARRALDGIYPAEYQTRRTGREWRGPGYHTALRAELPKLGLEIERMSHNTALKKYIDFPALQRGLARFGNEPAPIGGGAHVLRALLAANYIAWFNRSNFE